MGALSSFKECVETVRWQYSRTYPKAPHEYTVFDWSTDEQRKVLKDIARYIHSDGIPIIFWGRSYNNLFLGEYKYWIMEQNPEETVLINRTYSDEKKLSKIRDYINSSRFIHKKGMSLEDIYKEIEND